MNTYSLIIETTQSDKIPAIRAAIERAAMRDPNLNGLGDVEIETGDYTGIDGECDEWVGLAILAAANSVLNADSRVEVMIYPDTSQSGGGYGYVWHVADGCAPVGIYDTAIVHALDDVYEGNEPKAADLAVLRANYPTAVMYSEDGERIGPIFPESTSEEE